MEVTIPSAPVIARLRDGTPVGAWMFKANPDVWDVLGSLDSGTGLDSWRMATSYRVGLVRPGHPCALWVTGASTAQHVAGVWAVGAVTGQPFIDVGDPDDPAWRDRAAASVPRPYVAVSLSVLKRPVARAELRADPRCSTMEVLRRPRMGSPLIVTPPEWGALEGLVDAITE